VLKRFAIIALGVMTTISVTASVALAQYPPSKAPADPVPPTPPQGVAFTGANIFLGGVILIALVVVGAVLLLSTRRGRLVADA
jgi:hypothetical protein